MKALIQRVSQASVSVGDEPVGSIGPGLLILICAMQGDDATKPGLLAAKISKLRIFRDDNARMNRSLLDSGGAALVISQFTLAADTSRGNRPGFSSAAHPSISEPLYEAFATALAALGIPTQKGRFGADMDVSLTNDGPVTIALDL